MWKAPEAKPEGSSGTSTFKMILGGRYLQQDFKGKVMGQSFTGLGLMGYNNLSKKYESIWLDSMGTAMMKGEGTFDDGEKMFKEAGRRARPLP